MFKVRGKVVLSNPTTYTYISVCKFFYYEHYNLGTDTELGKVNIGIGTEEWWII